MPHLKICTAAGTMKSDYWNFVYAEGNIKMVVVCKMDGYKPKSIKDSAWKITARDPARHEKGWNSGVKRKVFI